MKTSQQVLDIINSNFDLDEYIEEDGSILSSKMYEKYSHEYSYSIDNVRSIDSDKFTLTELDNFREGKDFDLESYVFSLNDKKYNKTYYIKFTGWYNSWNGTEWGLEPKLVIPVEKTITVWELSNV